MEFAICFIIVMIILIVIHKNIKQQSINENMSKHESNYTGKNMSAMEMSELIIKSLEEQSKDPRYWEKFKDRAEKRFNEKNILFDSQRPNDADYGYSLSNPIMTSTIFSSDEYLKRLRTPEGQKLKWKRLGSANRKISNICVPIDIYELFLHDEKYTTIYICPYGHDSSYAPKGLKLKAPSNPQIEQTSDIQQLQCYTPEYNTSTEQKNDVAKINLTDTKDQDNTIRINYKIGYRPPDKNPYGKMVGEFYNKFYNICHTFWVNEKIHSATELAAVMYVITDMAVMSAGKDRSWIPGIAKYLSDEKLIDMSTMQSRIDFYGEIIRGEVKLRGDCIDFNLPNGKIDPIYKCCIAYGDISCNPDCADNYKDAPILIRGITDMISFNKNLGIFCHDMEKLFEYFHDVSI